MQTYACHKYFIKQIYTFNNKFCIGHEMIKHGLIQNSHGIFYKIHVKLHELETSILVFHKGISV